MDNLTHSLIGAALGQAGLKRKTGLAMPALIVGANIPDIDVLCFLWLDGVEHLGFRRGITHGPIAMVVLPLLLAWALWGLDRWQTRRGTRPEGRLPMHFGWLLALSFIACLSHPLFDWFNNYGVRLLEPFSSRWFYGDTLFIIDPWIIAMLGAGIWWSLRRERTDSVSPHWPAGLALVGTVGFVLANFAASRMAAYRTLMREPYPNAAVANAVPIAFWKREMLLRTPDSYGSSEAGFVMRPTNMSDPRIAQWSQQDPAAQTFLFWSRMPVAELHEDRIILRDQRFLDRRIVGNFSVTLRPSK